MSKYDSLWKWIKENGTDSFTLTFAEMEKIAGVPVDHSFLRYKKELAEYGFAVGKISMKEQTVAFRKCGGEMELRRLTVQDRKIITDLFRDVFTHEPWNDDWSNEEQLDAYISDLTGQAYSLTLGFFDGDRLAGLSMGYIKHWYSGTEYVIDEFCVDRRMQGKGTGSAFLKAMEAYLMEKGIRRIFLQTEKNVPAYSFYLHHGFRELDGHVSFAKELG